MSLMSQTVFDSRPVTLCLSNPYLPTYYTFVSRYCLSQMKKEEQCFVSFLIVQNQPQGGTLEYNPV